MNEKPYYVFVVGSQCMNQTRTTEALTRLRRRVLADHPDRVLTIVHMDGGGSPMYAKYWANGWGHPILCIPCPTKPGGTPGWDRDHAAGARRVLDWVKVDVLVAFREKGHEGRPIDAEVRACIDECVEEFIKTYIVETL